MPSSSLEVTVSELVILFFPAPAARKAVVIVVGPLLFSDLALLLFFFSFSLFVLEFGGSC